MRSSVRIAAAAATVAGLVSARLVHAGIVTSQTIATTGTPVNSPPNAGEVFGASFSSTPSINSSGLVAFQAPVVFAGQVSSGLLQNNIGLFSGGIGGVNLLAQSGYLAPSAAGGGTSSSWAGTFSNSFGTPIIGASGNTTFTGGLILTTSGGSNSSAGTPITSANNSGIWGDRSGSVAVLSQIGNTTAGSPSTTVKSISNLVVNPSGTLVYGVGTSDTPATGGVVIDSAGTPAFIVRGSSVAPGTGGANYSNGGFGAAVVNPSGQIAFRGTLSTGVYAGGPTITSANNQGIWKTVNGTLQLVAQAGTAAPGLTNGEQFSANFVSPDFNNAGQTVFNDTLITGVNGVTSANSSGIWSEGGGTLHLVARSNFTAAPNTNGSVFNGSLGTPVINTAGKVAFTGSFNGGTGIVAANNAGVFTEQSGIISLIAQKGTQAPGLASGVTLTGINAGVALNALGNLAFSSSISSGGSAIFAQDPSGTLNPLIYTGESLQISPGFFGNVSGFTLVTASGGEDGRAIDWNDSNIFAVAVQFNTGGVVSSAVMELTSAVPEPTSSLLLLLGVPMLLRRRRPKNSVRYFM